MKRLIATLTLAISLLIAGTAQANSTTWHSNRFQSPSGNIICVYTPGTMECGTRDTGHVAWITRYSAGRQGFAHLPNYLANQFGPILNYGKAWNITGIMTNTPACGSSVKGIECVWNHNEFIISRSGVILKKRP